MKTGGNVFGSFRPANKHLNRHSFCRLMRLSKTPCIIRSLRVRRNSPQGHLKFALEKNPSGGWRARLMVENGNRNILPNQEQKQASQGSSNLQSSLVREGPSVKSRKYRMLVMNFYVFFCFQPLWEGSTEPPKRTYKRRNYSNVRHCQKLHHGFHVPVSSVIIAVKRKFIIVVPPNYLVGENEEKT